MDLLSWFRLSTIGWWIWVPAALVFSAYLSWTRLQPARPSFVPLVFAGLWLASCVAHYFRSNWQEYFGRHLLWLSGLASILVAAVLPLVVALIVERSTARIIPKALVRGSAAATVAILVTLFMQQPLAVWVGASIVRLAR